MPTWGELLVQIQKAAQSGRPAPLDEIRRDALKQLYEETKRPVILYASRWVQDNASPQTTSITLEDLEGVMEVLHGIPGPSLDIVLHSGGGSPTATEAIVNYIRTKFEDVRVFVPMAAMSAATMFACSANRIVMGKHSYLGPIDPQLILQTPLGISAVPAEAIRDQFKMAQDQAGDKEKYATWIPMLQQYGPALLVQCDNVIKLSRLLVAEWLEKWMFSGRPDAKEAAKKAADMLAKHQDHLVHGRHLSREWVRDAGLVVDDLEQDQRLQDAVLTVFHSTMLTFGINPGVQKLTENHAGKAFIKITAMVNPQPQQQPQPPK